MYTVTKRSRWHTWNPRLIFNLSLMKTRSDFIKEDPGRGREPRHWPQSALTLRLTSSSSSTSWGSWWPSCGPPPPPRPSSTGRFTRARVHVGPSSPPHARCALCRKAVKATLVLLPLLGITYMLFFVNPGEDEISQIVFIYFNSFLESFQVRLFFFFLNNVPNCPPTDPPPPLPRRASSSRCFTASWTAR